MSDLGFSGQIEATSWIDSLAASRRAAPAFKPWHSPDGRPSPDLAEAAGGADAPEAAIDLGAVRAESFAQGFEEGRRTVELEVAAEREALRKLAEALEALRPEPAGPLAALLAETVDRLVRQIVGEVDVDPELLMRRAETAAALIGEELAPTRLLVHPDDVALLDAARIPVPVVGDASLVRGTVALESAGGWLEDGPAVRLDRLRAALDRLGAPS